MKLPGILWEILYLVASLWPLGLPLTEALGLASLQPLWSYLTGTVFANIEYIQSG